MLRFVRGMLKALVTVVAWAVVCGPTTACGETTPASLEMTKRVVDVNGAQATIAIDIKATPPKTDGSDDAVPNVLVLGTLCSAHGFSDTVLKTALDSIATIGNVDYYFFNGYQSGSSGAWTETVGLSGSLAKGSTFTTPSTSPLRTSNHSSLRPFYVKLNELITSTDENGKSVFDKYDYVVFSFDRTRAVNSYTETLTYEETVAAKLAPFYEKGRVVWLVDNYSSSYGTESDADYLNQAPKYADGAFVSGWFVSGLYPPANSTTKSHWSTLRETWSDAHTIRYRGLMGLFDPVKYSTMGVEAMVAEYLGVWGTGADAIQNIPEITSAKIAATREGRGCGATNPNQIVYDNADNVGAFLRKVIVALNTTLHVTDTIQADQGLTLGTVAGYSTTDEDVASAATFNATQWTNLSETEGVLVKTTEEDGVMVTLSGLTEVTWVRLRLNVEDTGFFRTSVEATEGATEGVYKKNPNKGPAVATLTPDGGDEVEAEASAESDVFWSFPTYTVTTTLTGTNAGKVYVAGRELASVGGTIAFAQGSSPKLVFVGDNGKSMSSLVVDGSSKTVNPEDPSWTFSNLSAGHEVAVAFEADAYQLLRAKQRYPWNNLVDLDYFLADNGTGGTGPVCDRLAFFVTYTDEVGTRVTKQLKKFVDASGSPLYPREHDELRSHGAHRITWDANAEGVAVFRREGTIFSLRAFTGVAK